MNKLLPLSVQRNLFQPTCWSAAAVLRWDLRQVQGKVQQELALHVFQHRSGAVAVMPAQNFNGLEGHIFKRMGMKYHGITGLQYNLSRGDHRRPLVQLSLPEESALRSDQADKGFIQSGLENPQRWCITSLDNLCFCLDVLIGTNFYPVVVV